MSIIYYIKFNSSLCPQTILNYGMLYLIATIITSLKFLKNLKNNQINQWLKYKTIALEK